MVSCKSKSPLLIYIVSLLSSTGLFIFNKFFSQLYSAVDNYNLSLILNKLFSDDTYSYYLHPFLCWMIGVLSDLLPTADAYLLCSHLFVVTAISLIIYLIVDSNLPFLVRGILLSYTASLAYLLNIWSNNYTIQAGLFSAVGAIFLLSAVKHCHTCKALLGTFFLCLGYMWRAEGFFLIIPFLILHMLTDVLLSSNRKAIARDVLKTFWIFALCISILAISRALVNNSIHYSPSIQYSTARTLVEDYPVLKYDEINDLIPDLSEIEYRAATNWSLIDTANINTELFEKIGKVASTTSYPFSFSGAILALKDMVLLLWQHKLLMIGIGSFFPLAFSCVFFANGKKFRLVRAAQVLLYAAGTALILLYFTIKGRAPLHVWLTVLLIATIMTGYVVGLCSYEKFCKKQISIISCISIITVMCLAAKLMQSDVQVPRFAINSRIDNYADKYVSTYKDDESVYIWGAWHKEVTQHYMSLGKLPSKEFMKHNISAGDWTYGQRYYVTYLDELRMSNPAEALIHREKTYLVDEDCSFVLEYLKNVYDEHVYAVQVGSIQEIPVWQFHLHG